MIDRESALADPFANTTDPDLYIPEWIQKEAGAEESWEIIEKRNLEIAAFARDFRRSFPDEAFSGIYKQDRMTGQKTKIKSTDEVLSEAFSWLKKKSQDNVDKAKAIVDATNLIDEYRTALIAMFTAADKEEQTAEHEKTLKENNKIDEFSGIPKQPNDNLKMQHETTPTTELIELDRTVTKKQGNLQLERKKIVGSYGVIVTETDASLWKQGKLIKRIALNDINDFATIAEEVEMSNDDATIETLFNIPQ